MPEKIPISKLLARFIEDRKEKSEHTRGAKLDTALALVKKKRLSERPYDRIKEQPILFRLAGLRIPVRNEVKYGAEDEANLTRLDKEIGPVGAMEHFRSIRRAEPDIIRSKKRK